MDKPTQLKIGVMLALAVALAPLASAEDGNVTFLPIDRVWNDTSQMNHTELMEYYEALIANLTGGNETNETTRPAVLVGPYFLALPDVTQMCQMDDFNDYNGTFVFNMSRCAYRVGKLEDARWNATVALAEMRASEAQNLTAYYQQFSNEDNARLMANIGNIVLFAGALIALFVLIFVVNRHSPELGQYAPKHTWTKLTEGLDKRVNALEGRLRGVESDTRAPNKAGYRKW